MRSLLIFLLILMLPSALVGQETKKTGRVVQLTDVPGCCIVVFDTGLPAERDVYRVFRNGKPIGEAMALRVTGDKAILVAKPTLNGSMARGDFIEFLRSAPPPPSVSQADLDRLAQQNREHNARTVNDPIPVYTPESRPATIDSDLQIGNQLKIGPWTMSENSSSSSSRSAQTSTTSTSARTSAPDVAVVSSQKFVAETGYIRAVVTVRNNGGTVARSVVIHCDFVDFMEKPVAQYTSVVGTLGPGEAASRELFSLVRAAENVTHTLSDRVTGEIKVGDNAKRLVEMNIKIYVTHK
ncbi:MAG: hypothetical protein FJX76_18785 [Armatimonadetes bacterium]|nr:hypothetical protein [Armatimonadota bacterium]